MMLDTFVEQLAAGSFKAVIGDGRSCVDNTHVENVVDGHLLAAQRLAEAPDVVGGQAYSITDDERINGIEWFRPLVEGLGYPYPKLQIPARLAYGLGFLLEATHYLGGAKPTLTRKGVLNLTRSSSFRIDKARRDLGYEPRRTQASDMAEIVDDVRQRHDRLRERPR